MQSLLGRKLGMTQFFDSDGQLLPVTVILAGPCAVVQKKEQANDGYQALQIGFEEVAMKKVKKPLKGHFQKAKLPAFRFLREVGLEAGQEGAVGQIIKADIFQPGDYVHVSGMSKGKGFQGVMKRHHFRGGADTHGSMFHRAPGSIGSSSDPSRVFKGMRMAGHMGSVSRTIKNLEVLKVDIEKNLLVIKGSIPGADQSFVVVSKSDKAKKNQRQADGLTPSVPAKEAAKKKEKK